MEKKLTHDKFIENVRAKNKHVAYGDVEILGDYVSISARIQCRCNIHNVIWSPVANNLYKGCGCPQCGNEKISQAIGMSHEQFIKKVLGLNEYIKNGDIEIIGEYHGADSPIECICHIHNFTFYPTPSNLYRGQGCKQCGSDKVALIRRTSHEDFIQRVNDLNKGIIVVGEYVSSDTPINFKCNKGHIWSAVPSSILSGTGCPYCSGLRVIVGKTSLWDVRPDIANLLENKQDGYKYSAGTHKKANFVCPGCSSILLKSIVEVCKNGLSCEKCSDGISYAEKLMASVLLQLKIDFKRQVSSVTPGFEWIKCGYKYDYYIAPNNNKVFIEMDGGLGHGNLTFYGEQDVDGARRDIEKDRMALDHNIQMIRIDCNYKKGRRFEHIKNNIMTSDFASLFDLSIIDWDLCNKQAQKKIVVQIAELYNDGKTMSEMMKILNYDKATIQRRLRQANKAGLCVYDSKELSKREGYIRKNNAVAVNRYTRDGLYVNSYISLTDASIDAGSSISYIYKACGHPNLIVHGYKYYRADDPNQPDKSKIILNNTKLV